MRTRYCVQCVVRTNRSEGTCCRSRSALSISLGLKWEYLQGFEPWKDHRSTYGRSRYCNASLIAHCHLGCYGWDTVAIDVLNTYVYSCQYGYCSFTPYLCLVSISSWMLEWSLIEILSIRFGYLFPVCTEYVVTVYTTYMSISSAETYLILDASYVVSVTENNKLQQPTANRQETSNTSFSCSGFLATGMDSLDGLIATLVPAKLKLTIARDGVFWLECSVVRT